MKRTTIILMLCAFLTTGCTGSFNLTRKVYHFHREQPNKWADEISFLVVAILPIYGLATFADAVIFNTVEFWTDENPIVYNPKMKPNERIVREGGDMLIISRNDAGEVILTPQTANADPITFERTDEMVLAKNETGEVMFSSMKNEAGDISIYDKNGDLMKQYSAEQIHALKSRLK